MLVTVFRTLILYIFVTISIRLMGKRQIGDMQPNELVVTLLVSEIAAMPLQDTTQPIINGIIAIFMLVIIEIVISVLTMKSQSIRKILSGHSIVIIKNGQIDQKAMKKVRLTIADLIELLRQQDVFDIDQVAFAVLEVNGNLSVMLKNTEQPPTQKQLNIKSEKDGLQMPVIIDGKVIKDSLAAIEYDRATLDKLLKSSKMKAEDVFLMTLDRNGNSNIVRKEESET